jgi:hypothetical protein
MSSVTPLVFGLAAGLVLVGCEGSVKGDQSPAPARASPTAPSSLSDQQIEDVLQREHLRLVGERLRYIWCGWLPRPSPSPMPMPVLPNGPVAPGSPNTGTTVSPTNPNEPAPAPPPPRQSGYSIWATYVADHIESGTTFGPDYPQIAADALDPTGITDSSMSWCRGGTTTFMPEQKAIATTNPAQIGSALFEDFSPYDQDTRRRAAHKIRR